MSTKITMSVNDLIEMRDHMALAIRLLDEGKYDKVRAILDAYHGDAIETLERA